MILLPLFPAAPRPKVAEQSHWAIAAISGQLPEAIGRSRQLIRPGPADLNKK